MTAHWPVAATCLIAAAVVLGWPQRSRPARLLTSSPPATRSLRARVETLSGPRMMILAVALAALTGTLLAGPVAGVMSGGYGAIAVRTVLRRRASRAEAAMRARSLDALCGLAADLRAGLPATGAASADPPLADATRVTLWAGDASRGDSREPVTGPSAIEDRRMAQLAGAAWRLAERTGAPIADLVERIEADARAMDRASAAAAAQAAGARATAWLLAGLPVGGIALGYTIGADPLAVLLHTPIGAACAVGAIALQVAGLAWADRIASAGSARPEPAPLPTAQPPLPAPAKAPSVARIPGAASASAEALSLTRVSGAAPAPTGAHRPTAAPAPKAAPTPAYRATEAPPPAWPPDVAPASTGAPRPVGARAPMTASGAARAPKEAPQPALTPAPDAAAGVAQAPTGRSTPAPLWTAAERTARLRSAAPVQADSADEARDAVRPKPHPLPRAAASRRGAVVADRPGAGSDS